MEKIRGRIEECSDFVIKSLKKEFGKISLIYFSNDDLKKGDFKIAFRFIKRRYLRK